MTNFFPSLRLPTTAHLAGSRLYLQASLRSCGFSDNSRCHDEFRRAVESAVPLFFFFVILQWRNNGQRKLSVQLPALTITPHHSSVRRAALFPHSTPPCKPQRCMIVWKRRSLQRTRRGHGSADPKTRVRFHEAAANGGDDR